MIKLASKRIFPVMLVSMVLVLLELHRLRLDIEQVPFLFTVLLAVGIVEVFFQIRGRFFAGSETKPVSKSVE
jgi:hypothetical protein